MKASAIICSRFFNHQVECLIDSIFEQKTDLKIEIVLSLEEPINPNLLPAGNIVLVNHCEKKTLAERLNTAAESAGGDYLVFVNEHCLPTDESWIDNLILPMRLFKNIGYTYGSQTPREGASFDEVRFFQSLYPEKCKLPQKGYYCNNNNSALKTELWRQFRFENSLPALEDVELAKRLCESGHEIGYASDAKVAYFRKFDSEFILNQYRREARAMHKIFGSSKLSLLKMAKTTATSIVSDSLSAIRQRNTSGVLQILRFRLLQFKGSHIGRGDVSKGNSVLP